MEFCAYTKYKFCCRLQLTHISNQIFQRFKILKLMLLEVFGVGGGGGKRRLESRVLNKIFRKLQERNFQSSFN